MLTFNKKAITGKNHEKLEFVEWTYQLNNNINFVEFIPNKLSHKILTKNLLPGLVFNSDSLRSVLLLKVRFSFELRGSLL